MPETVMPTHTFTFLPTYQVTVSIEAPDLFTAQELYHEIDGSIFKVNYATAAGPKITAVAIDNPARPALAQINGDDPVVCEDCEEDEYESHIVNGRCTRNACPGLCDNAHCREPIDGGGWNGECGSCADVRASHDDGDHDDEPDSDCVACVWVRIRAEIAMDAVRKDRRRRVRVLRKRLNRSRSRRRTRP